MMTPKFTSLFGSQPGRSPLNGLTTPPQSKPMRPFTSTAFRPQVTPLPPVNDAVRPLPPVADNVVRPLPPVEEPMRPMPRPMASSQGNQIQLSSFQSSVPRRQEAPLPPVKPLAQPPWGDQQMVTNQNAFQFGPQPQTLNLGSLIDQSQQFSSPKKLTETQDQEPDLGVGFAGGAGWSEQTLAPADYVQPFLYQPYQPTRRYEVL